MGVPKTAPACVPPLDCHSDSRALAARFGDDDTSDTKVRDPDPVIRSDQYVGRLDVTMAPNALRVGVLHPVAELDGPPERLTEFGSLSAQVRFESVDAPIIRRDILHGHVEPTVDPFDVEGANEIRMQTELDPDPRLFLKKVDDAFIQNQLVAEGLHRAETHAGGAR